MINRGKLSVGKRILAGVLAMTMAIGMAGCGKKEGGNSESGNNGGSASGNGSSMESTVDVKNCTFELDSDFSFDKTIGELNNTIKIGDSIYALTYDEEAVDSEMSMASDTDSASDGDADFAVHLYKMPVTGGQATKIYDIKDVNYVSNMVEAGDNIGLFAVDNKQKHLLIIVDKDGKEVSKTPLTDLDKNGDMYISSVKVADNGDIIAALEKDLAILGSDGKEKKKVSFNDYLLGVGTSKDGKILALTYGLQSSKSEAVEVNLETGELGEHYPINAQFLNPDTFQKGEGDYDFFYTSDSGLYGYKMASKEDVKLCDFNASLIDGTYLRSSLVIDQDHFILAGTNYNTMESYIDAYKKVDPANVVEKKVLTLACLYQSPSLRQNVIDFNKTRSDIRIDVIDYMNEEDPMTKFSTDIAAGNIPDLYDVSQGFGNMSLTQAANKGMFVDLTSYLANDPDLSESDLIESVLNATKIDGKVYYLGSSFYLNTLIGNKDDLGKMDGWTFDEMKQYIDSKPADATLFEVDNKTEVLNYFMYTCLEEFVDWNKGECYFDQQSFKNVLELCNKGSDEEIDYMNFDDSEIIDNIKNGKQLFLNGSITPDIWPLYNKLFNDKAYCIGYPNAERKGMYAQVDSAIAMSAGCSDKDVAWEFIKFTMSREQQGKNYYATSSGMPTRKDIFELFMDSRQTTKEYTDEFGNNIRPVEGSYGFADVTVEIKPISDEERQQYVDMVNKVSNVWEYDKSLMDIVSEESKYYFNGDKSLDEVCSTIQNRAQTYINESK